MIREIPFTAFTGFVTDKTPESGGESVMTEFSGFTLEVPVGDGYGAALTSPGWELSGNGPYVPSPGYVLERDGLIVQSKTGGPTPAIDSIFTGKVRLLFASHPSIRGDIIATIYCGKSETDLASGMFLSLNVEDWGDGTVVGEPVPVSVSGSFIQDD